jgi:hypothetical protein
MKNRGFVISIGLFLATGLFFVNGELMGQKGDTNSIGGAANPSSQTGWFFAIPYHFGVQHLDKADIAQYETTNIAKMKVVDPAKLLAKGFTGIKIGDMVQVKRISDKQAKIKLLPDGPEKTVDVPK